MIVVSGGFDPIHSGHIDHIRKASELGELTVIVSTDEQLRKKKGFCLLPLRDRMDVISSLRYVSDVVGNIDTDGTSTNTLLALQPDIFVKGGDRTELNMPQSEVDACIKMGCKIIYGLGDLLNSSTNLVKDMK